MYGYDQLIDLVWLANLQMRFEYWVLTRVLVWSTLVQAGVAVLGLVAAFAISRILRHRLGRFIRRRRMQEHTLRMLVTTAIGLAMPVIALLIFGLFVILASAFGWPYRLLETAVNLLGVWIVIRLTATLIRNESWANVIALLAFAIATLNILGLLPATILFLDGIGASIGGSYVSVFDALIGAVELAFLLWLALTAARLLDQRIQRSAKLTPSLKVLSGKMIRFALIASALLIGLSGVGIDLTAFAVFTGALGVGIGFGLQKPISNLISGVILLLDRSIKPGDVIELGDPSAGGGQHFGWVTSLNARYVSLTTRDGTEWLIPNEDLITQRIINWSYQHDRLRLLTPFGVSFDSDVRLAMELSVEAAKENPRVLKDPAPVCRLMGFEDSTVNLELRLWIADPKNGIINVRSDVLLVMWEKYRRNGIRTPLGHRDVYIKNGSELDVHMHRRASPSGT